MHMIGISRNLFFALCLVFVGYKLMAQKTWSLDQCLEYARTYNLQIEEVKINALSADVDREQTAQARYPNLSGTSNFSYNFGRNIDPTTNDFVPTNLGFNSISISSRLPLYSGGRLRDQHTQAKIRQQEWTARVQQTIQDVELNITTSFLNILFESERKRNNEEQLAISESQLERVLKLIEVETAAEAEQYQWIAEIQADKQLIRSSENAIENSIFQLKNLLNLDANEEFSVEQPDNLVIEDQVYRNLEFSSIFDQVIANRPEIKAQFFSEQAAEKEVRIARSYYLPSFGIGGGLSTNFSSLAKTFSDFNNQRISEEGVFINGESVRFEQDQIIPGSSERTPYFDQLNQNLGIGVGVQLNVPIYDRGIARANVKRAEYALQIQQNTNQQNIKNLELEIQQILADFRNAQAQYLAGQTRVEFLQNSYDNTLQRYDLGMSNNFELLDIKNRLNQAINDFTIAKYELIFRSKIIDFYTGKKMRL